jgi:hypothetical protein
MLRDLTFISSVHPLASVVQQPISSVRNSDDGSSTTHEYQIYIRLQFGKVRSFVCFHVRSGSDEVRLGFFSDRPGFRVGLSAAILWVPTAAPLQALLHL